MTPLPRRLQLSRRKGFDLQAHSMAINGLPAVNCARPGKWGNRWKIGDCVQEFGGADVVKSWVIKSKAEAAAAHRSEYATYFQPGADAARRVVTAALEDLRGKNLFCWCDIGEPCHCDTYLVLANAPLCEEVRG